MGYSDTITAGPFCRASGGDLRVSWESSSPDGTTFQVYVDRRLAWSGSARSVRLPTPPGRPSIDVVAVDPGSESDDYSGLFDALPSRVVTARWSGGRYLSEGLVGFRVHLSPGPGLAVDYSAPPAAIVPWAPLGIPQDGYGIGGYGLGGYGRSEVRYEWSSGQLAPGVYAVGVVAFDGGGALGPPAESSATVSGPPRPPSALPGDPGGARLAISVDPATRAPTLTWGVAPA